MKRMFSLPIELLILLLVLWFIFHIFGVFYGAGDSVLIVWYFFAVIFSIDSAFYIALRILLGLKQKTVFRNFLTTLLIALLFGAAAYGTISTTGHGERIGILFLLPLILLGARYLFLKVVAKRNKQ